MIAAGEEKDARFSGNTAAAQEAARNDARRQLVEKALSLYVQKQSLSDNYELVRTRLLPRSNEFIAAVLQEDPPQTGKDGLASVTTRARVNVRLVQQTLNQMSRDERVEFIRNNGDPKISVAISTKPEEGQPARSPVAENILKERIQSFGFRTWSEEGQAGADFAVSGEAKFKKALKTLGFSKQGLLAKGLAPRMQVLELQQRLGQGLHSRIDLGRLGIDHQRHRHHEGRQAPRQEQRGCLHANMDLYKWCTKLGPLIESELLLDCLQLAADARELDMRASPYDLTAYGFSPIRIELPAGRAEYSRLQTSIAERAEPLRHLRHHRRPVGFTGDVLAHECSLRADLRSQGLAGLDIEVGQHTRAPSRARRSTVSRPTPLAPPVTRATLPSSLIVFPPDRRTRQPRPRACRRTHSRPATGR